MPETIVRLLGLVAGLHGLSEYASWKYQLYGVVWDSPHGDIVEPPTYLDVWVLLPEHFFDWQKLGWVVCGVVLIRFSKQIARILPRRGS